MAHHSDLERAREEITRILSATDERFAAESLLSVVYSELRRLAAARLAKERDWATLGPTELVHEAYLRLLGSGSGHTLSWNNKGHFFGAAALAMRRILVERARRRALRRRGDPLAEDPSRTEKNGVFDHTGVDLLELDLALTELERVHPRPYQVVMTRFFAGLGVDDTAAALGISEPTVKRDWSFARAWLLERMARGDQ